VRDGDVYNAVVDFDDIRALLNEKDLSLWWTLMSLKVMRFMTFC